MQQTVKGERTGFCWNLTIMLEDLVFADDITLLLSINNEPSSVQDNKVWRQLGKRGDKAQYNEIQSAEGEHREERPA